MTVIVVAHLVVICFYLVVVVNTFVAVVALLIVTEHVIAKLNPAQSNSNSVGWAEIAFISTFTLLESFRAIK